MRWCFPCIFASLVALAALAALVSVRMAIDTSCPTPTKQQLEQDEKVLRSMIEKQGRP